MIKLEENTLGPAFIIRQDLIHENKKKKRKEKESPHGFDVYRPKESKIVKSKFNQQCPCQKLNVNSLYFLFHNTRN